MLNDVFVQPHFSNNTPALGHKPENCVFSANFVFILMSCFSLSCDTLLKMSWKQPWLSGASAGCGNSSTRNAIELAHLRLIFTSSLFTPCSVSHVVHVWWPNSSSCIFVSKQFSSFVMRVSCTSGQLLIITPVRSPSQLISEPCASLLQRVSYSGLIQ